MGFFSGSSNSTSSKSSSEGYSFLDPQQQQNQQQLINQFQGAMPYNNPVQARGAFNPAINMAMQAGQQTNPYLQRMTRFATPNNALAQQQINQLGGNISRQLGQYNQQIGGDYAGLGQRGSDRHGVAQGLAMQGALQQFNQGATDIYANSYNQAAQAQAQQAALYGDQMQNQVNAAGVAGGLQAQRQAAFFNPFLVGSEVIGSPSVLNYQQSQSSSKGESASVGLGF